MNVVTKLMIWVILTPCVVSWIPASSSPRRIQSLLPLQASQSSWQSHVSTHPEATRALQKVLHEVTDADSQDVAFLFVGQAHADTFEVLVKVASSHFGPNTELISLVGGGVIGEERELDIPNQACLSLLTGKLPKGAIIEVQNPKDFKLAGDGDYLLFADPWSDIQSIVDILESSASVLAGGITCPISQELPSLGYMNQVLPTGSALTVRLSGTIGLQTVVAQGCRPIGDKSLTVTEIHKGQVITKLNDKSALEVLQEVTNNASPEDRRLIETGLLCGIASSDGEGDYLSRQIAGIIPSIGGIVVGAPNIQEGDKFCFQVRDAAIAEQDLKWMVERAKAARLVNGDCQPLAAIQISCVARGRGMFGAPNADITNIMEMLPGEHPVIGGFFANGEIGPVGISGGSSHEPKPSHVHGFTTVVATIYRKRNAENDEGVAEIKDDISDAWG
jgi:small ligand-binding sensory domain FIST